VAFSRASIDLTTMHNDRWERIQEIFHGAVELPREDRQAFVETHCGTDAELVAKVLAMIEADERDSPLDRPVSAIAEAVINTSGETNLPQQHFGAYRVTGVLGEGGMGVVYLAEREDLGTRAAVKILRDAWLSPARRERFAAEQRTLAQLEHPSIARLYDSGTLADGTPWFVMEYVEGTPITDYCRASKSSLRERLGLFRQICEAVQFAHGNLVVHRDLKPSNILVRADGSVKLLDFGISKHLDALDMPAEQTRTAIRMMTPAYASPEQIRGDPIGTGTDVYSLGVVLYQLIVGRLPFDLGGKAPAEAERIILEREVERPAAAARRMGTIGGGDTVSDASKGEWADIDVLILTAMHKDVARRYPTVYALNQDVERLLSNQPLDARGDSAGYRLGKFVSRHRRSLVAASIALAAVVALVVFYTIRLTNARNVAIAQTERAERMQGFTLNLLQGGDEEAGPADSLRVVTLIDRGVQEAQALDREPATQAQLYQTLGELYVKLGKFERADTLLRKSLAQKMRLYGTDNPEVAQSLLSIGKLMDAQAEYDSADALVTRGLAMMKRHLPLDDPRVWKASVAAGTILYDKGDYDRSIAILSEAVRLAEAQAPASADLGFALSELANTHFYAGNYAISDTLNRRALAIDRRFYGNKHPHVADDLMNLGQIQFEMQNFAEAERFDSEALVITRAWYGNAHPETASNLTLLGRALVSQKKLDEGAQVLREAVEVQERAYGPVHPRVASALNELGRVAQQQGNLGEAEKDFRRVFDIYRQVYNDKHYTIAIAQSNLAGVYKDQKRYDEAGRLFTDVFRRYKEELTPDHQLVGIAKVRYAELLLAERKLADAEREFRAGDVILKKQSSPPPLWLERVKKGLDSVTIARRRGTVTESD
jgi:serine/threonine-protein kinase